MACSGPFSPTPPPPAASPTTERNANVGRAGHRDNSDWLTVNSLDTRRSQHSPLRIRRHALFRTPSNPMPYGHYTQGFAIDPIGVVANQGQNDPNGQPGYARFPGYPWTTRDPGGIDVRPRVGYQLATDSYDSPGDSLPQCGSR